ncbi:indoleamine 2,3-dioxygenase 2-like [Ptychodera flava]|uniref:indoleamine 2,3-dioxygenase 2-like n=1 Tax=Ptychodera flava TaxID=63121 RepID=UPI00396A71AD
MSNELSWEGRGGKSREYYKNSAAMAADPTGEVPRLEDFHVSEKLGFVLQYPLTELPPYFNIWNELGRDLTDIVYDGTIREKIEAMPLLDHNQLEGHRQLRLAHLILSCLASGYVWMEGGQSVPARLPESLAVPLWGVSQRLGIPAAVGMHYSVCLANWKLLDPSGPVDIDNMDTIVKIQCGIHEAWFFLIAVQVELDTAPGLVSIVKAQQAVKDKNHGDLVDALKVMTQTLAKMKSTLTRMHEKNDPDVFFNVLRIFLSGWDHESFKRLGYNGLIYDGVSEEPVLYTGGSAAQGATLYSFDEALGVKHDPRREAIIAKFKEYIPPDHRAFIKAISRGPSIKSFVESIEDEAVSDAYNQCVKSLADFRSYHLQLACKYITIQAHKNAQNNNENYVNQSQQGTGGTGFMQYLKGLRNNTSSTMVKDPNM